MLIIIVKLYILIHFTFDFSLWLHRKLPEAA
jgi:hypothetical protein